jgi:hypothetical protein
LTSFDPDASERRLRRSSWLLVLGLSFAGLLFGAAFAAAVLAGGALSALNMEGLVRLVHRVTSGPSDRASWLAVFGVGFRYLLLGIGLFVIVSVWRVNVIALSLGLSAPAAAVFLELVRDALREFRSHSDIDTSPALAEPSFILCSRHHKAARARVIAEPCKHGAIRASFGAIGNPGIRIPHPPS